jgi:hypothetical protein
MRKRIAEALLIGAFLLALIGAFLWRIVGFFAPEKAIAGKPLRGAPGGPSDADGSSVAGIKVSGYVRRANMAVPLAASPRCFARAPGGSIWVAGGAELLQMSGSGAEITRVPLMAAATALDFDADGTMLVAEGRRVELRDGTGALERVFTDLDAEALVVSIAIDPLSSDVFLADAGNKVILRYSMAGTFLGRIGEIDETKGIPGFVIPSPYFSIAVSPDHRLFAANPGRHGIEVYSYDGALLESFYRPSFAIDGFAGCCNPACIFVLDSGHILTVEKGIKRIKIVSPTGELLDLVADEESLALNFLGDGALAGPDGRLLVLDRVARAILVFEERKA